MITIETFRAHRHTRPNIVDNPDILVIHRDYRVRLYGDRNAQPWEIWRSINIACLHALDYQSTQRMVFVGSSSLLFHDIPTWSTNLQIETWPSKTVLHLRPFPAVYHRQAVVPSIPVISRSKSPRTITQIGGLGTGSPIETVVRLAPNKQPRDAFVALCMATRALTHLDRFKLEESRRRYEQTRREMLEELSRFSSHHDFPRAKALIEAADGGCDNIFKTAVLWIIKSLYSGRVVTQFPIAVKDHIYFGDIALPDLKVIIEPDGRRKFGDTKQEIRGNIGKWLTRQHDLANTGWRVIRVRWHDTRDLVTFRTNITAQTQIEHLPLTQQSLRLWAELRQQHVPCEQKAHRQENVAEVHFYPHHRRHHWRKVHLYGSTQHSILIYTQKHLQFQNDTPACLPHDVLAPPHCAQQPAC